MQEDELRFWANAHAPAGSEVAMAVLDLFGKIDSLRAKAQKAPVLDRAHELVDADGTGRKAWIPTHPDDAIRFSKFNDQNNYDMSEAEKKALGKLLEAMTMQPDLKPFDGSTGTPEHGRCGRKENTPPGQ